MRSLAKASSGLLTPSRAKMPVYHAHGCEVCSARYSDACTDPHVNARCSKCSLGRARSRWDLDHDPKVCCLNNSEPVTKEDRIKYGLGGTTAWYRCRTCSRNHPFRPGASR